MHSKIILIFELHKKEKGKKKVRSFGFDNPPENEAAIELKINSVWLMEFGKPEKYFFKCYSLLSRSKLASLLPYLRLRRREAATKMQEFISLQTMAA